MFETDPGPHVFALAPGVDFPRALVAGLEARLDGQPPEAMAHVDLIVNTARMRRRLLQIFDAGPPRLLPRIRLLTELGDLCPGLVPVPAMSSVQRRLELMQLISQLLDAAPELAPRAALFDLAGSLGALMDEMQGEGVAPDTISTLDVSDQSGHWQRAQRFIDIARDYMTRTGTLPDNEARQRTLVEMIAARWDASPPTHPIILAGSTGSRGTTLRLMQAISRLPKGALVLPGFDFDMPLPVWGNLSDPMLSEDHPQYRFYKLVHSCGTSIDGVAPWHNTPPPAAKRNAMISLALRPAPVTNAWITEGPDLQDLDTACTNITLLEAASPREEALAIALRLRAAAETGTRAALITPDRMLSRQVASALDQWRILPDDSAGEPLHLSPPGRYLRHVAALFSKRLDAEALLTLLKHPLCYANTARNAHVLMTRKLELAIRHEGLPYPDAAGLKRLLAPDTTQEAAWTDWVSDILTSRCVEGARPLADWLSDHISLAEELSAGPKETGPGALWDKRAGMEARKAVQSLQDAAGYGGTMTARDYEQLLAAHLSEGEVRDRDAPRPDIMIWGTLEARVQGADLVILGGLNEGSWPEAAPPDPWLNRSLRNKAGLLLPERRVGLSAHDFQQAIAAPEVWLTRSIRSEDAETVASRWLNRIQNLLGGLGDNGGRAALDAMRARGAEWQARARQLEAVKECPRAVRPSPRPPVAARPSKLSVTEIKTLIRDPYAIYARHVLGLRKLGPLVQTADALLRGTVAHDVMEQFLRDIISAPETLTPDHLRQVAQTCLSEKVPWPAARALWQARLDRVASPFVTAEVNRAHVASPVALEDEAKGRMTWPDIGVTLTARADRIDRDAHGAVHIYDYKTGKPPSPAEQRAFDKQLLIEAGMVARGAFPALGPSKVAAATYLRIGSAYEEVEAPLEKEPPREVLDQLHALLTAMRAPEHGFTARRMMKRDAYPGDYDQLSRFGEWDATQDPVQEDLP